MKIEETLGTSKNKVWKLQKSLQAKAKNEPNYRFYSLWDKVWRTDTLMEAYKRCRHNRGAAGADKVKFADIELQGIDRWLGKLQEELRYENYVPMPLLRVWIPKGDGKKLRPLSIPTIRDRVVQTALLIVLNPIFDEDLHIFQYGFRPQVDAKMAVRRLYYQVTEDHRTEIVDGDLADYFTSIPHGKLLKCVARRVSDGRVLRAIKMWIKSPVIERKNGKEIRSTEAKDSKRGVAQGSPLSPLLSNLYFRRFMLAWEKFGYDKKYNARIINYADDFVICCKSGNANQASLAAKEILSKLGLTLNEEKTSIVNTKEDEVTFLGYTLGPMYGKGGRCYIGTHPSRKALKKVMKAIHEETSPRWNTTPIEKRVKEVNRILRGWCGYFNQGPVIKTHRYLMRYTGRRLRRWLMRKHKRRGTGYRQYPDGYFHEVHGLYKPPLLRNDLSSAKAC